MIYRYGVAFSGKKVEVMADSVSSKETIRLSKSDYRSF